MKNFFKFLILFIFFFIFHHELFSNNQKNLYYALSPISDFKEYNVDSFFLNELKSYLKFNNLKSLLAKTILEVIDKASYDETTQILNSKNNDFVIFGNLNEKIKFKLISALENDLNEENCGWSENEQFINPYTGKIDINYLNSNCITVIKNEKIIGFLKYRIIDNGKYATVYMIKINEKFQKQGIGRELFRYAEKTVFSEVLYISSTEILSSALPFWEKEIGIKNIKKEKLGKSFKYSIEIIKPKNKISTNNYIDAPFFIQKTLRDLESKDYKGKSNYAIFNLIYTYLTEQNNEMQTRIILNSNYFKTFLSKVIVFINLMPMNFDNDNSMKSFTASA